MKRTLIWLVLSVCPHVQFEILTKPDMDVMTLEATSNSHFLIYYNPEIRGSHSGNYEE
jgi:hypothetical protein